MALPNYYEILEVPFDATAEGIRRSFRDNARRFHPDAGRNWSFDFSLLTEAYNVLRDPIRREAYNQVLQAEYPYYAGPVRKVSVNGNGFHPKPPEDPLAGKHADSGHWSVIGAQVAIRGHVSGPRDLVIKGEVHGTVRIPDHRLLVAETGKAGVYVEALEIEVWGTAIGELRAHRGIKLRRGASVMGEIRTPSLAIEDGVFCSAKVEMTG